MAHPLKPEMDSVWFSRLGERIDRRADLATPVPGDPLGATWWHVFANAGIFYADLMNRAAAAGGMIVSNPDAPDVNGQTALHWAAEHGATLRTETLLEKGCSPNVRDWSGKTPLMVFVDSDSDAKRMRGFAGNSGGANFVDLLLRAGAVPWGAREDDTLLDYAAAVNRQDCLVGTRVESECLRFRMKEIDHGAPRRASLKTI